MGFHTGPRRPLARADCRFLAEIVGVRCSAARVPPRAPLERGNDLAFVFLTGTATEWLRLITPDGLTIGPNLFGTTFYTLVGATGRAVVMP